MYKIEQSSNGRLTGGHEFPQKSIKTTTNTDMNSKETVRTSEEGGTTTERKTNQRMKCRPTRGVVLPFLHSKFLSSGFKFVVLHTKFIIQLDKIFIVTDTKSSYSKTCFVPLKDTCQNFKPTS